MNLLYFTETFYPHTYGGGEYIFYLISKELVKRGHNVSVITNRFKGTTSFEKFEGITIYRVGKEKDYSKREKASIKYHLEFVILAFAKGMKIISESRRRSQNIDIIHSNTYFPTFSGQLCATLSRIPHIITFHDVYTASNQKFWNDWIAKQDPDLPFYTARISKLIERIIMKLPVRRFHTVSDASKEDLLSYGINISKINVIENGLQLSDYDLNTEIKKKYDDPYIVFVGRLVFYKNVDTIIEAFKSVLEKIPNVKLLIIGDGPYKKQLIEKAESLTNEIIFTGKIEHYEKVEIIKGSSFLVFPSLYEGFGIAIIEGFACKKPVIVADVRPLSDIVKDEITGYVVAPMDSKKWAEKIIYLLKNSEKQKEMGMNAYDEFLDKYRIEITASKMEKLYSELLASIPFKLRMS
jgi:glycosyltransferase involved in cell wall biosynthesis